MDVRWGKKQGGWARARPRRHFFSLFLSLSPSFSCLVYLPFFCFWLPGCVACAPRGGGGVLLFCAPWRARRRPPICRRRPPPPPETHTPKTNPFFLLSARRRPPRPFPPHWGSTGPAAVNGEGAHTHSARALRESESATKKKQERRPIGFFSRAPFFPLIQNNDGNPKKHIGRASFAHTHTHILGTSIAHTHVYAPKTGVKQKTPSQKRLVSARVARLASLSRRGGARAPPSPSSSPSPSSLSPPPKRTHNQTTQVIGPDRISMN